MKTICAWCQKIIKDGDPPVSHTICSDCKIKQERISYLRMHLNDFETEDDKLLKICEDSFLMERINSTIAWDNFKKEFSEAFLDKIIKKLDKIFYK